MNYIPLNVKTHYELMSSIIKIDNLIVFLNKNSIPSCAISDSNMFSSLEFINTCKNNNIKPIIAIEIKIDDLNMILYAKNYDGYINLLNIVSKKNIDGLSIDFLKLKNNNLICVTKDYNNIEKYKNLYEEVYLSYSTKEEKLEALMITSNIVYIKKNLYINKEDEEYLKYLTLIKEDKNINEIDNYSFNNYIDYNIEENDAKTTYKFSSLINIELPNMSFELPKYIDNEEDFLNNLCFKGLNKRLSNNITKEYTDRLNYELSVIKSMNFTNYFLIVYDFILYAKKNNIFIGPGRGSAAGSLVSYALGITEIDPIKYNLIFERFLNPDRITMPDIDVDIDYLKRDELIQYVKDKYGINHVSSIITFSTFLPKQVIRDVAKILNIEDSLIDNIIKTIKDKESFNDLRQNKDFLRVYKSNDSYKELIRISAHLEGLKRHTSIHASGIIISKEELNNRVPLYKSNNELLSGYQMDYLDQVGLIKIDFLALKNLSIISNIIENIKQNENINININKIPLNDKKTIDIFKNANTLGIFQFESNGMISFLKELKADSFNDLISAIALYRPGPKDNIPEYIRVKNSKKKPNYILPELENILKDTNGIIIYQEQIIEILKVIGGFTYSKADIIRRAISKKNEEIILKYKEEFINNAINNNYSKEISNKIYDLIIKFASYGFNKSHSVAYSLIAYQMAYLKTNYLIYFMIELLNCSIGNIVKTSEYINECKKFNIDFILPNINYSTDKYYIKNNEIIMPFGIIKGIGKEAITSIIETRNNNLFIDYIDFIKRTYSQKVNTKIIECLIYASCLDIFNINKKTMITNLQKIIDYTNLCNDLNDQTILKPEINEEKDYDNSFKLNKELELFGIYLNNHPITKYRLNNMNSLHNIKLYFDKTIYLIVLIDSIRIIDTKNKEKMAFLTLSDEYNKINAVIFPKILQESIEIKKGDIIYIKSKVEKRFSEYQLVIIKILKKY